MAISRAAKALGWAMALGVLSAGVLSAGGARAGAPMARAQPGYYRLMLGAYEVTALNDGVIPYATPMVFPNATPDEIARGLADHGLTDPVGMSYNAFLINTGDKLILVDTGTGGKQDDSPLFHGAGRLMTSLRAAGYRPDQVDEVLITHAGPDHIGGLTTPDGKRAFPKAILRAPDREFAIYLDPARAAPIAALSPAAAAQVKFIQDLFKPYIAAGRYQPIDGDIDLGSGVRAIAAFGHTPGHTVYMVESQGQRLLVMGDLVHVGALQFAHPELSSRFDANQKAAAAERQRLLGQAAQENDWVAGGHLSFPGLGHVRAEGGHFAWNPAAYALP